jgi:hypothetical protein
MPSPQPKPRSRKAYELHVLNMIAPGDPARQRAICTLRLFDVACDGHLALLGPERRGCRGFAGLGHTRKQEA